MQRLLLGMVLLAIFGPARGGAARAADAAAGAGTRRPNILLITVDDLGVQLSCYGEKQIVTPQMDALAAQGVRFARAYAAQASSSSSLASLMTGTWPHQNGQVGLAHCGFTTYGGAKNLPSLLAAAGYRTGILGKLQVSPQTEFPWDWKLRGKAMAPAARDAKLLAAQSHEFFARAKTGERPFFLYVSFFDAHGPAGAHGGEGGDASDKAVRAEDIKKPLQFPKMKAPVNRRMTAMVFSAILRLDAGVGLLLTELKDAGLADNTLVILLGTNGLPTVRARATSYEAGVHIPLLVRWPGVAEAGLVREDLVSAIDVMPTLLAAAHVAPAAGLPGQPLGDLLHTGSPTWRQNLFTEMNFHEPDIYRPQRTVRDDRYKLVVNFAPERDQAPIELFDLQDDPDESKNLAHKTALADVRRRLETALHDWQKETGDPLMDPVHRAHWKAAAAHWQSLKNTKAKGEQFKVLPSEILTRLK